MNGILNEFRSNAESLADTAGPLVNMGGSFSTSQDESTSEFDVILVQQDPRLKKLMHSFCKTEMGRALADVAKQRGIKIYFDHQMELSTVATYYSHKRTIALNYTHSDELLLCFLAHELRHVWQHKQLSHKEGLADQKGGTPVMSCIIFDRYIEADAWAFAHSFAEDFSKRVPTLNILAALEKACTSNRMYITVIKDAPYESKIDFYAIKLGSSEKQYAFCVCDSVNNCLDQVERNPNFGVEFHPAHLIDAQIAAQELRMFDKPFMGVPAPFAHIKTDEEFAASERLFLDSGVKVKIQQTQERFDLWAAQKYPERYRAKTAGLPPPAVMKI